MHTQKPRVGVALDSGGAKGSAHIGVMDVLFENKVPIDIITGSSAGAFIGALYASGRIDRLKDIMEDMSVWESLGYYVDPVLPFSGFLGGKKARAFIHDMVGDCLIEDLPIRFVAVATDLLTGETVSIDHGPLTDAIMASVSMPGIFKPVVHMDRLLTDGGVSNPLPLDILKSYSPAITIASNLHSSLSCRFNQKEKKAIIHAEEDLDAQDNELSSWMIERITGIIRSQHILDKIRPAFEGLRKKITLPSLQNNEMVETLREQLIQSKDRISMGIEKSFTQKKDTLNIFEIMFIATNIQQYQKNRLMLATEKPDILLSPEVEHIGSLEFNRAHEIVDAGKKQAKKAIPDLIRLIDQRIDIA